MISSRFEVTVGVDYSSDVKQVMQILKAAVDSQMGVLKARSVYSFTVLEIHH
jgi:small-conductance mechanosensitive channel